MSRSKKKRGRIWAPIEEKLPVEIADCHTHIHLIDDEYLKSFNEENIRHEKPLLKTPTFEQVIEDCKKAGISRVIECACELPNIEKLGDNIKPFDNVRGAIAIHPNEAALHAGIREVAPDGLEPMPFLPYHELSVDEACERVYTIAKNNPQINVIGETGVDLFRSGEKAFEAQKKSFEEHIRIAKELDLTLQIHDRDAHRQVLDILDASGIPERTVIHSFSGDAEFAKECASRNIFAGFSGPVTFNANDKLREAWKYYYDNRPDLLVFETDAPFLAPTPYRGNPNSPYLTYYVVKFIAEYFELDLAKLCEQIHKNESGLVFYK